MKILHYSVWWPTEKNPNYGIFIKRHVDLTRQFANIRVVHNTRSLLKELILFRPDIVHFHVLRSINTPEILNYIPFAIAMVFKKPYIITEHNTAWIRGYKAKRVDRFILNRAKEITAVSKYLGDRMPRYTMILPNVIMDKFRPLNHVREHCGIQAIHVSLLKDSQKNISGILKAIKKLNNDELRLLVVGDGYDRSMLNNLAEDFNLKAYFVGRLSDDALIKMLQDSDFFILNSRYETFSVVTAEALACGLPVIVSRCGGPEEFVDESNGLIGDDLVGNLSIMIDRVKNKYYDGEKISRDIKAKFGESIILDKLWNLYMKVIYDRK